MATEEMAYDVLDLAWDADAKILSGTSKVVGGDPYQLRIHVPDGFRARLAEAEGAAPAMGQDGRLLTVDFTLPASADVRWSVSFE